jgi:hypothetical protein
MPCIESQDETAKHLGRLSLGIPCKAYSDLADNVWDTDATVLGGVWEVVSSSAWRQSLPEIVSSCMKREPHGPCMQRNNSKCSLSETCDHFVLECMICIAE